MFFMSLKAEGRDKCMPYHQYKNIYLNPYLTGGEENPQSINTSTIYLCLNIYK